MPDAPGWSAITPELAELLGLLAADGYVSRDGSRVRLTNNDLHIRGRAMELWSRVFLGVSREWIGTSGFDRGCVRPRRELLGHAVDRAVAARTALHGAPAFKQVPPVVLNADAKLQRAFLDGYYAGDGLKRGNGESIKTNSSVLAQGLCLLYLIQGQPASVYVEHRDGTDLLPAQPERRRHVSARGRPSR